MRSSWQWGTEGMGYRGIGHMGNGAQQAIRYKGLGLMGNGVQGKQCVRMSKDVKCQKIKHLDYRRGSKKKN